MSFNYKRTVTINHLKCGTADSANFPVRVEVTHADLKDTAHSGHVNSSSGYDIRPYSDNAGTTALTFQLLSYDPTTGHLVMYVKTDITVAADKVIYLFYGDSGLGSPGGSTATWDSNHKDVWPLDQASSPALGIVNGFDLGQVNGPTFNVTGQVGKAVSFSRAAQQSIIESGADTSLKTSVDVTIMGWAKLNGDYTSTQTLAATATPSALLSFFLEIGSIDNKYSFWNTGGGPTVTTTTSISDDGWHHIAATRHKNGLSDYDHLIYLDGNLEASVLHATSDPDTSSTGYKFAIGNLGPYSSGFHFNGTIDQVSLHDAARSASWIKATYNNEFDVASFISLGTESAASGGIAPVITSVTPNSLPSYASLPVVYKGLTIAGTALTGGVVSFSNSNVTVDGTPTVTSTLITLDVKIAAGAAANVGTVTVTTADGSDSDPFSVTTAGTGGGANLAGIQVGGTSILRRAG